MLLEMHSHSSRRSACSHIDPVKLVRHAQKKGLQGIIITEHHYLWSNEEIATLKNEAEVEENFLILSGQELGTDIGHVLVFGADRSVKEEIRLKALREIFPDAALVWAHPFRHGKIPTKEKLLNPLLDGIEIFSLNHEVKENYQGLKFWHDYKFTAISGSDTHAEESAGIFPTQFDHPVETIGDVVREIKNSRCRPFFKEIPKSGSNIVVTQITIGTKGEDEFRQSMILKNVSEENKWEKIKESSDIVKQLLKHGFGEGVFRVPKIIDINEEERFLVEERQRGKMLSELLPHVNPSVGKDYLNLTARWLAKLHNTRFEGIDLKESFDKENEKLDSYMKIFTHTKSPHVDRVSRVIERVRKKEKDIYENRKKSFVLSHGDFHPKNIIIGQDRMQDISTLFVSIIDLNSISLLPKAFDVGYFLSQFQHQFKKYPQVLHTYKEQDFIEAYIKETKTVAADFKEELELFKLRANLSIASYLIKLGKGESQELSLLIEKS